MTAGRFREVDLDLLADYVGGALAGTPDEATVARLVADDDAWGGAYAELAPAVALVRADLAGWAEPAEAMPATVADRLSAALAGAGPAATPVVPAQPVGEPGRPLAVVGTAADATGHPGGAGRARRRRWSRRAGPVLVAAAAVAAAGFGVTQFVTAQNDGLTAGSAAQEDAGAAGGYRLVTDPTNSGTRYTPESLASAVSAPGVLRESAAPQAPTGADDGPRRPAPAVDLSRLADPAALDTCLGAVSAAHGATPITVDRLEYASFQNEPALVVGLVDAAGERWIVVTGPECGVPGSGADTRYRTRVG
ncbi:hypothetical protein [Micromonospora cathayae]|uniref:Uncharacterized protein n=1 Tax=Micromonospora cathayae TaxID=3028804 RepID=A0ABY7ZSK6_9ACTN|nr:hypothetical protein [Micromonospora sp. HUAS 3]WDZ86016.1 hypothetical protein PVK37_06200 [Micromonospora sp. HUAS 3]